jgi:PAS domain S-box-containing protein
MKGARNFAARMLTSLKTRILAGGMIAMVLAVGLSAVVLVQSAERNTLLAEGRREINEAASTASRLSGQVVGLQRALDSVATQLGRATIEDNDALRRFAESQSALQRMFTNVFAATADGSVRIFMDGGRISHPALNLLQRRYFQDAVVHDRSTISSALPGTISGAPFIVFAQPVRDGKGVFAVLAGTVRLDSRDLLEGLVDSQGEDSSTMVVVTDELGQILAHPDRAHLLRSLSGEPRLAAAFASWRDNGAPAEPTGLALTQPDELVSAAGVPGPNWMIWRVRSKVDLLAPLREARIDALVSAVALLMGLMPLLLAVLWWLLRPLGLLEHRASHMFDRALPPEQGWPRASGEIANLSKVLRTVGIDRTRLELENAQTMSKLSSVMSAAPMGIAFAHGLKFELLNKEFCRLFGGLESDLLNEELAARFWSQVDFETFLAQQGASFGSGETYAGEWQMRRRDGTSFWAALRCSPVNANNTTLGTVWTFSDVEEIRASRELLEWSASHDPLTGLANRKAFELRAGRLIETFPASHPASMVFIDLDRFKPVNDTAGHLMGDLMLLTVAKAIMGRVRAGDLVARIGGR